MRLKEANERALRICEQINVAPKDRIRFVEAKVREFYCEFKE